MARARKDFTEEEMAILKTSPHVMDVSSCIIHFTAAFKSLFWQKFQSGMAPAEIFRESGIDPDILGKTRVNGFKEMLKAEVKRGKGFRDLTTANDYYAKNMYEIPGLEFLGVDGVIPSTETIRSDAYGPVNPFYVAIRADEPDDSPAGKLFHWLLSEEGQKLVEDTGYVPAK